MNRNQLPLFAALSFLAACQCTLNPSADPNALVIEPATLTLIAGGQPGALTAHRVSGEDVTSQVTWLSADQALARVEGGMVSGLSAGTLVVSAQLGEFTAGAAVAVNADCIDGQRNNDETDTDCGGRSCAPCSVGGLCVIAADCASASCVSGVCAAAASCADGVRNGTESSTDCGGRLCPTCGSGAPCNGNNDCASRVCANGVCQQPTCFDGARNGDETGDDCGGPECARCEAGQSCTSGTDCASGFCVDGKCQAATCTDGLRNGTETGQDCGGGACPACATGGGCTTGADCAGGVCTNSVCQPAGCADGVLNGDETGLDCGGTCRGCDAGNACLTNADCSSGRCEQNVCLGATCSDGVRNGDETGLDCGGPLCPRCETRQGCTTGDDCLSSVCNGGICQGASCTDGVKNGTETALDCGGPTCAGCAPGQGCIFPGDCATGVCTGGLCQAAACADGVKNGMETGLDCGGPSCASCAPGEGCTAAGDCTTGVCTAGQCQGASCTDGVKNGMETAVDCGGPSCSACATGEGCSVAGDCSSGVCTAGVCQAATCSDSVRNGAETAVDCGGPNCASCGAGEGCSVASDCATGVCTAGQCQAPTCSDAVKNGTETAVDCGGPSCSACAPGEGCTVAGDCRSGVCTAGVCQAATCTDSVKNGAETAIDCGGSECPSCATGQGCTAAGDCATGVCTAGACQAATCSDTVKNGAETAIDCGGSECPRCAAGQGCTVASDCATGVCAAGVCQAATCSDTVKNGAETDTDCGGTCPSCGNGNGCTIAADCSSQVCSNGTCVTAACTDGVRNGRETGLDCGGPDCASCGTGQGCTGPSDCGSGVCTGGTCSAPSCTDGVKNGLETAIDCGGGTCAGCGSGLSCELDTDCASGNCVSGTCGPAVTLSITVTPATSSVPVGRSQAFTATATRSDGTTIDVTQSATWTSSDPSTATISSLGVLQSLAQGTTRVQAISGGLSSNEVVVTVVAPALERIDLTPTGVRLPIGLVQAYEATGTFSDGSIADLTPSVSWSSDAPAVATISASGVATGVAAGTTNVIASTQGVSGQTALIVTSVSVTSISVSPATLTLPVGVRAAFVATALLSDGTARDITQQATWQSSSPAIAQVSSTSPGLVTASSVGTANITATLAGTTSTGVLTVLNVTLNTLQVFPADETVPRGFSLHYGAVGLYSDGNAYDLTLTATWSSTAPGVASVSNTFPAQGVVNTLAVGVTQIGATLGSRSGATSLRVTDAQLTSLSITPALLTLPIGAPRQYLATGVFDDGTARDVTSLVRWQSSNLAVATISNATSSRGLLTSLGAGTATITATLGSELASAQLRVTNATLEQLVISPPTPRVGRNGVVGFVATAVYTDGTGLDVTEFAAWTSSNTNIATVRNDTGFRGVAVGVNSGTVTIGATFGTANATARLTVTGAALDSMSISPAVVRTGLGIGVQFYVSGLWSDGTTGDLTRVATWTSSLSSVAVISNAAFSQGLATTRGQGVTTIRAAWAGIDDTTTLTVTSAALTALTVTPAVTLTGIGIEVQYRALARFSDGTTFDVTTNAAWISSSPAVASVSGAAGSVGLATALSGGVTTITARMGAVSGSATLTVSSAPLVGLTVTPASGIIPTGFWRPYTATAVFDDGLRVDITRQATWTTGTPTVAHAGNGSLYGGRVTGLSVGTSTVVARFNGQLGTALAIVMNLRLVELVVTPQNATTSVGDPLQLTAMATFSDGTTTIQLDITLQVGWQVSPKKNGTVSNTDGSRAVVTMYNDSSSAVFHAIPPAIAIDTAGDAHTKVYSP